MTATDIVVVDEKTMTKDAAIEHLQGKIAALEVQIPVQDAAIAARDAARQTAFESLRALDAAKHDQETPHGAYVNKIRDAWKTQPAR